MLSQLPYLGLVAEAGEVQSLRGLRGWTMQVGNGAVWLTETGDPVDHWLVAGDCHLIAGNGLVVFEAAHHEATTARVRLLPPASARPGVRWQPQRLLARTIRYLLGIFPIGGVHA